MAAPGRITVILAASAVTLLTASPLKAEEGDYSFWQTLANLVSPPKADNKVTPAQRQGNYPLRSNPSGFADALAHEAIGLNLIVLGFVIIKINVGGS